MDTSVALAAAAHYGWALAILAQCGFFGAAIMHRVVGRDVSAAPLNGYLVLFFAIACGFAANMAGLLLLGLAGGLTPVYIQAFLLGSMALAGIYWQRFMISGGWRWRNWLRARSAAPILPHVILVVGLLVLIASYAIRVPGHSDDTAYHLPYARFYLEQHGLAINEYLRFPLFPNHMNLLFSAGLVLDGDIGAQIMATLPLFVLMLGLIGACLHYTGGLVPGVLATVLFLRFGPLNGSFGYAYVDNGLALFAFAGILALMLWIDSGRKTNWLYLGAGLAGTGASIKLFGAIWTALLTKAVFLLRRFRAAVVFGVIALVVGGFWYVRSFIISGDPIHPVGASVFGYYLWNEQDLLSQVQEQHTHGVSKNLLNLWPALVKANIPHLAPAFLLVLLWRRCERSLQVAYLLFLGYFLFWFFATQVSRYLSPVIGIASFLSMVTIYRGGLDRGVRWLVGRWSPLQRPLLQSLVVAVLVLPSATHAVKKSTQQLGQWQAILHTRAGYDLFQAANQLIPQYGNRLVKLGYDTGYFFNGVVIGDHFGPGRYTQFAECWPKCNRIAPERMAERLAAFKTRMLVVSTEEFAVDVAAYRPMFDIRAVDRHGVLMTLRE